MQRHLVAASLLACAALPAFAQSSVTLYGTIDTGITYTSNQSGSSVWQENTGSRGASKWGIKGREDLGGGYATVFNLEGAFSAVNGQYLGNREFGRYADVGLTGPFGTVTVGRQYDLAIDYAQALTGALRFAGAMGTHAGDFDNLWGTYELDNDIKYVSPDFYGFTVASLISAGGVAGDTSRNSTYQFAAGYNRGPLRFGATYQNIRNPAVSLYGGAAPATGATYTNPITNPVFNGYISANRMQIASAGGLYQYGNSTFGAQYSMTIFGNMVDTSTTPNTGSARLANYEVSYLYQFTPAVDAGIAYDYTTAPTAHYNQINFGSQYNLSKLTYLYLIVVYQHASGTNSQGQSAVANISTLSASSTSSQLATRIGIRHSF